MSVEVFEDALEISLIQNRLRLLKQIHSVDSTTLQVQKDECCTHRTGLAGLLGRLPEGARSRLVHAFLLECDELVMQYLYLASHQLSRQGHNPSWQDFEPSAVDAELQSALFIEAGRGNL